MNSLKKIFKPKDSKMKKRKPKSSKNLKREDPETDQTTKTVGSTDSLASSLSATSTSSVVPHSVVKRRHSVPVLSNAGTRRSIHARHATLTDGDFEGLLIKSRGWLYDPLDPVVQPHHQSRFSMAGNDFDRYIFK